MPMGRAIIASGVVRGAALAGLLLPGAAIALPSDIVFPGAQGYGAGATGWRGGEIFYVTSLEDNGEGTLRSCARNGNRPRVCLFAISGTIGLDSTIRLGSNLYIAGQTAPGDGIQLVLRESQDTPLVMKDVTDIVIRSLKVRPGPSPLPSPNVDGITIEDAQNIYLDRLSLMFATDENFNIHVSDGTAADITISRSILALGLDRANHPKGRHSKGALICSDQGRNNACGRITIWQNLFAHNRDRNPDLNATSIGPVEVINNVFYNPISQFGEFYNLVGETSISYVGNVALSGPSTNSRTPPALEAFEWEDYAFRIFAEDNLATMRRRCRAERPFDVLGPDAEALRVDAPTEPLQAVAIPASEALEHVLSTAGDRLPSAREPDALDARVIADVRNCTGDVIDAVDEVGGWPEIATVAGPADTDRDGLPDDWERARGLDPAALTDVWADDGSTGLPLIEAYLAERAGDPLP